MHQHRLALTNELDYDLDGAGAGDVSVAVATPSDAADWEAYVESRGDESGYHSWRWRPVFENAFGHECVYLIARRGGEVAGVLPMVHIKSLIFGNSLTSLPFLNYGGVIADTAAGATALAAAAAEQAASRNCGHVELRHVTQQFPALPCKRHKVSMRLPVTDIGFDKLDRKVRNQIRKAEKSGLVVERGGESLVKDFYAVFARNMRDLGTPVYSRRLFEEVLRAFPERARLHVVRLGGRAVAAGFTYATRAMTQLPWASSVRDFNSLCPNTLLYWDAIQQAQALGTPVFDMGRCTPGEGTFNFKAQWQAEPVALHWEYGLRTSADVPNISPANPKFHWAITLWRKLPLTLTRCVGPRIVRTIP